MKKIIFKLILMFLISIIISIFVSNMIIQFIPEDFTFTIDGVVQEKFDAKMFSFCIEIFIFFMVTSVFAGFYIVNFFTLVSTYKGMKKIQNENIIYQRDLPDDYNSAISSYILDGNVEVKRDYKAVLVELEVRKKIYIENGKYKVKNDTNNIKETLLSNQEIVLNQIKEGKINFKKFRNAVIDDATKLGYVQPNSKFVVIALLLCVFFPTAIFSIFYLFSSKGPCINILTEKGKKEKDKILKLKSYLNSFSNIYDLESSDNNIWDDYLAYAISLNVNKNLKIEMDYLLK